MNECNWEVIDGFLSPKEYERFFAWITEQINAGMVEQAPVQESYAGPGFEERWFKCLVSSETWRLVSPQDPFHGYWGPVEEKPVIDLGPKRGQIYFFLLC